MSGEGWWGLEWCRSDNVGNRLYERRESREGSSGVSGGQLMRGWSARGHQGWERQASLLSCDTEEAGLYEWGSGEEVRVRLPRTQTAVHRGKGKSALDAREERPWEEKGTIQFKGTPLKQPWNLRPSGPTRRCCGSYGRRPCRGHGQVITIWSRAAPRTCREKGWKETARRQPPLPRVEHHETRRRNTWWEGKKRQASGQTLKEPKGHHHS